MVACGGDCSGESGDVAAALTEAQSWHNVNTTVLGMPPTKRPGPIMMMHFTRRDHSGHFRIVRIPACALTDPALQHRLCRSIIRRSN